MLLSWLCFKITINEYSNGYKTSSVMVAYHGGFSSCASWVISSKFKHQSHGFFRTQHENSEQQNMWKFHSDHQCRTSSNQRSFAGFEFRCVKGEVSWWLQAPIPFGFVGLSCEAGIFQGISTRVKSVLTCIISFALVYLISLKPTTLWFSRIIL